MTFAGDRKIRSTYVQAVHRREEPHAVFGNLTDHHCYAHACGLHGLGRLWSRASPTAVSYRATSGRWSRLAQVSRHTGLLTGVYTLALFLFAPILGRGLGLAWPPKCPSRRPFRFGITTVAFIVRRKSRCGLYRTLLERHVRRSREPRRCGSDRGFRYHRPGACTSTRTCQHGRHRRFPVRTDVELVNWPLSRRILNGPSADRLIEDPACSARIPCHSHRRRGRICCAAPERL